jgi:hypothetical protein
MTGKTARPALTRRRNRRLGPHQMDLFGSGATERRLGAPAWRELPREAQDALTGLMTQLLLEHAKARASAPAAMEAGHDL